MPGADKGKPSEFINRDWALSRLKKIAMRFILSKTKVFMIEDNYNGVIMISNLNEKSLSICLLNDYTVVGRVSLLLLQPVVYKTASK